MRCISRIILDKYLPLFINNLLKMFFNGPRDPGRDHKHKSTRSVKDRKLSKLIASDSDAEDESEHELSYYIEDKVKLMKEVLKIVKPRKIKSMAPDCMKNMDMQEINSMLLEELLGISNKRLKYIFEGKTLDEESSTDEDQPVDVISLDDISDDDFVVISDEEVDKRKGKHKRKKIKEEPKEKPKKMKKEKPDKEKSKTKEKLSHVEKTNPIEQEAIGEENLMSVLELLELQARARAIRSQLELENKKKLEGQQKAREEREKLQENGQEDDDEIIMEVPQDVEIVITSSDSENEAEKGGSNKTRCTEQSSARSVKEYTNNSSIQTNEDSSQDSSQICDSVAVEQTSCTINQKGNRLSDKACDNNDIEEGEISDIERRQNLIDIENDVNSVGGRTAYLRKCVASSNNAESDSDSSDNLQVVMEREKRKKHQNIASKVPETSCSKNFTLNDLEATNAYEMHDNFRTTSLEGTGINEKATQEIVLDNALRTNTNQDVSLSTSHKEENAPYSPNSDDNSKNQKDKAKKSSKIQAAIKEFMKTQPRFPDNTEELQKIEEERKFQEDKSKREKEKRIKNLKNKLHSFKQDVAVESGSVTILENILIKPKIAGSSMSGRKHLEHCDDLVINVDQEDLDCIVCD